ncbi:hypothetical protein Tco_1477715 [Tanacetum coccineum]
MDSDGWMKYVGEGWNYAIAVTAVRKGKQSGNFQEFLEYSFPYYRHIYTPSFKTLDMAALYILDKLSEAAGSTILEDKMKDRWLVVELEALGQQADTLKPLEYTREIVACYSARVGVLEQLLAGAHVGMSLKAGYTAKMEEAR